MASPKTKMSDRRAVNRQVQTRGKSSLAKKPSGGPAQALPKVAALKVKVPRSAPKAHASPAKRVKALLQSYGDAVTKSRTAGSRVSFRVDVDPNGETLVTPFDEATIAPRPMMQETTDTELPSALAAARERGRLRAAEILGGGDMLSADAFAKILGTTRVTVNTKRQSGQVLGLDGAKRGFRFPVWQLDAEGRPYAELAMLHERLGGPWAVYRFLVQPHGELDGLTGREALERGRVKATLEAVESIGRDFR